MPLRPLQTPLLLALLGLLPTACDPEPRITEAAFELHTSTGCELGAASELELTALGDFPPHREPFSLDSPKASFDSFPLTTRELALSGVFAAAPLATGRAPMIASDGDAPHSMIVLPEGRSCPLSDRGIAAAEGAAVAALPGGGMLIAGGTASDGKVLKSAVAVGPGELIGEDVPDGMFLRRRYATATLVGTRVVVAGGAEGPGGSAEETYEVYDSVLGIFARELSGDLLGARMEHGAALLPNGSILLAGGRSEPDGAPLATAELVGLTPPAPDQPGDLVVARVAPSVLVLDSGAVIVAGGRDADGAVVPSLERFEAAGKRFVRIVELPSYENSVAVALPGARIAWVGCDTSSPKCGVTLVLLQDAEPVSVDLPLDWAGAAPFGLSALRTLALDDGRLLVTGRDPDANMMARALLVDLDAAQIESVEASRAPSVLVSLADGSVAELDAFGTSLRRLGSFSVYDSPTGDVLATEARRAVLDASPRWNRSDEGLRALVSGARVDVPHLRFGNFRCEVRFEGDALIWVATSDARLAIGVGARVSAPGCSALSPSGRIVLERRAGSIELRAGSRSCSVSFPSANPARLAIEAEADTVLRSLSITRL
jgi:hypothetical protein